MIPLIASDNQTTATKLRHALGQAGHECPYSNIVSVERAAEALAGSHRQPSLVFLVLAGDLDRSLTQLRQLRAQTSATLVAVGATSDASRILGAVHAGADDYLNEDGDIQQELESSFARLHAKIGAPAASGPFTIATSATRGSGASLIAANLAVLLAQESKTCGLLDLDIWNGAQAALLDLKPRHTIADLCRNLEKLDHNILEKSLACHATGVRLLAAPLDTSEIEHVTAEGIQKIFEICRASFPQFVVDFGDAYDHRQSSLLRAASNILLVFRLDISALRGVSRVLAFWDELQVDTKLVHLVANRSGQPNELSLADVEKILRRKVAHCLPDDPRRINLSVNCGEPFVVEAPKSAIAQSLRELARKIGVFQDQPRVPQEGALRPYEALFTRISQYTRSAFSPHMTQSAE